MIFYRWLLVGHSGRSGLLVRGGGLNRYTAGDMYEASHLAQFIAVLGLLPTAFLALNPEKKAQFWDEDGMCWFGLIIRCATRLIANLVIQETGRTLFPFLRRECLSR